MVLELEKILGTDRGKEAFYKSERNFTKIENAINNMDASGDAENISYNNAESELEAENVQDAVDELNATKLPVSHDTDEEAHEDIRQQINSLATQPSCRVYSTIAQSIPNDVTTGLSFNTARFDNDSIFSLDNPTKLTCKKNRKIFNYRFNSLDGWNIIDR